MNEIITQDDIVTQDEIQAVKSKHSEIEAFAKKAFFRAMEIGEWFLDAHKRMNVVFGSSSSGWGHWLKNNFPEISRSKIWNYMQLAKNRTFLETKFSLTCLPCEKVPGIKEAVDAIRHRDAQEKADHKKSVIDIESAPGNGTEPVTQSYFGTNAPVAILPPPEVRSQLALENIQIENPDEEPLAVFRSRLKSYAGAQYHIQLLEAEILERIRVNEFSAEQVREAVKFAGNDYPEVREALSTFIER